VLEGLAAEIRYYIIGGDPNEDFHLDQFSGKLSVNRGLDYERIKSYTLTIQVIYSNYTTKCDLYTLTIQLSVTYIL